MYLPMRLNVRFEAGEDEGQIKAKYEVTDANGMMVDEGDLGEVKPGSSFEYGALYAKFDLQAKATTRPPGAQQPPTSPPGAQQPNPQRRQGK